MRAVEPDLADPSGLGYHLSWADLSLTYRYLSFQQGSGAVVQNMSVRGPILMANFTFRVGMILRRIQTRR